MSVADADKTQTKKKEKETIVGEIAGIDGRTRKDVNASSLDIVKPSN